MEVAFAFRFTVPPVQAAPLLEAAVTGAALTVTTVPLVELQPEPVVVTVTEYVPLNSVTPLNEGVALAEPKLPGPLHE